MLGITALVWGFAFVAQKEGMSSIGPSAFNSIRNFVGSFALLPVIFLFSKNNRRPIAIKPLVLGSVCCGAILMLASLAQQVGILYTSAAKTAFITPFYIILVPIFGIFIRQRVRPIVWICVCISLVGLYLLCVPSDGNWGGINKGDVIVFICAILFTCHILCIDYFVKDTDGLMLSCGQFFMAGLLSIPFIFLLDPSLHAPTLTLSGIKGALLPLMYTGFISSGVGYTLQTLGQKNTDPTSASLILCLESVFGALGGVLLLHETLSFRESLGCIIMFTAIVVSQLPNAKAKAAK